MLGWVNDCVEKLVISKFGREKWHAIKHKAGCNVEDDGFFKLDIYTDKSTLELLAAACEVLRMSNDDLLETVGSFFVHYICDEGYETLLHAHGSSLKDWLRYATNNLLL